MLTLPWQSLALSQALAQIQILWGWLRGRPAAGSGALLEIPKNTIRLQRKPSAVPFSWYMAFYMSDRQ